MKLIPHVLCVFLFIALVACHSAAPSSSNSDKFPTEEQVTQSIVKGLSKDEVIAKIGQPSFIMDGTDGSAILYYTKPDYSPAVKTEQDNVYAGFQVITRDGKVTGITITHENKHLSP